MNTRIFIPFLSILFYLFMQSALFPPPSHYLPINTAASQKDAKRRAKTVLMWTTVIAIILGSVGIYCGFQTLVNYHRSNVEHKIHQDDKYCKANEKLTPEEIGPENARHIGERCDEAHRLSHSTIDAIAYEKAWGSIIAGVQGAISILSQSWLNLLIGFAIVVILAYSVGYVSRVTYFHPTQEKIKSA